MRYINFKSQYNKNPINKMKTHHNEAFLGFEEIVKTLKKINKGIICFELYPGVTKQVIKDEIINKLNYHSVIDIENYAYDKKTLNDKFYPWLTDDRVFGKMSHHTIFDYYDSLKLQEARKKISEDGLTIIYGFGASLLGYDTLISVSVSRWEIQLRYRKGMPNFKADNEKEDSLRKYKRGYFLEWRVADRIKEATYKDLDYVIDLNDDLNPVMITKNAYDAALEHLLTTPFRMVPYFDPGVWGGQWMKEVCNLDKRKQNYAWSFDGVPEENSVKFDFGGKVIELPTQDLVLHKTKRFFGNRVHGRFGKQFPIRFDLLDTYEGGNLSLQVHPLTEYIYDKFGMPYTQDESYYLLDSASDGYCYIGFKENVDIKAFERDLVASQKTGKFDAEKYVNKIKVNKHDHILIPAGTIHCSGKNTMVLEISACVYIFTFKLYDWGRLGLDGIPRPVHIKHGLNNLQYHRDSKYVKRELYNQFRKVSEYEEITGLHEREFLETRRATFSNEPIILETFGSVNTANLVEGRACIIESIDGSFEPFVVHYAETFIIPATISKFKIRSMYENEKCMIVKAHVR